MRGGWDCHAHVIERDYALSPARGYDPPLAPLSDYLALLDHHGLAHGVLVQPSVYGFDNRCLLDALERAHGRLRGVVVPSPDTTRAEFAAMHDRGVRAVRCNLINSGGLPVEAALAWQPILRELGWHIELHIMVETIADLSAYLAPFAVPVVIDHMGRPAPGQTGPESPALHQLIELVRAGACYVKVSAPYRLSDVPSGWSDVAPLAGALLNANPERCLWGTDWPHPDTAARVNTEDVFAALHDWCADGDLLDQVLVRTPAFLFDRAD